MEYQVGRPTILDQALHNKIIMAVPYGLKICTVSYLCKIYRGSLLKWLKKGEEDSKNNIDSDCAKLYIDFRWAQGIVVSKLLQKVQEGDKQWQSAWTLVKSIVVEDFGLDDNDVQKLIETVQRLVQDVERMKANPYGVTKNG